MKSTGTINKPRFIHFYKSFFFIWIVLLVIAANAQSINDSVFKISAITNFQLQDAVAGKKIFLRVDESEPEKLMLFIFLSPECPLCQNYSGALNNLYHQFYKQVNFYGVIPGKAYSTGDIKKFKQQYNISFRLLIDHNKKLTEYLQASVTPQVILLNNNYELLYKGAIDDWVQALGKQRVKTTEYFLYDALRQSVSNETVLIKRTKAVGCRINDY